MTSSSVQSRIHTICPLYARTKTPGMKTSGTPSNNTHTTHSSTFAETPTCELDSTGVNYRGNLSKTMSGYTCQNWIAQYPHEHWDLPIMFPNSGIGDHNYCRNPDGENTAWCYTTDLSVRWELCAVGYLDPECMTTPFCELHPTGVNYRGNLSQTISGYTCQHWTAQHPHNHSWIPSMYPYTGLGDHNHCRNPDGENTAWCYTTDLSVRWELCAVGYLDPECMTTRFSEEKLLIVSLVTVLPGSSTIDSR
nr:plasminogen-like [Lytechinus pictus]